MRQNTEKRREKGIYREMVHFTHHTAIPCAVSVTRVKSNSTRWLTLTSVTMPAFETVETAAEQVDFAVDEVERLQHGTLVCTIEADDGGARVSVGCEEVVSASNGYRAEDDGDTSR